MNRGQRETFRCPLFFWKGQNVSRNGRLNGRVCADDTKKTLWYNRIVPKWVVKPGMNAEYCPKEC